MKRGAQRPGTRFATTLAACGLIFLTAPVGATDGIAVPGKLLEPGEREYQLGGKGYRNPIQPDPLLDFSAGAAWGLEPGHQLGIIAQYRRTGEDASLRNLRLDGRVRVHRGDDVESFLYSYATLIPADPERGLGGGHHEGGFGLGQWYSLDSGMGLGWRAGVDRSDALDPDADRRWQLINRMRAELNLYRPVGNDAELFLHFGGKQAFPGEDRGSHTQLTVRPGMAFGNNDWTLRFSAGPNLARSDEVPRYSGEFMFSRRFAAPQPSFEGEEEIPRLQERVQQLEEDRDAHEQEAQEQAELMEELKDTLEELRREPEMLEDEEEDIDVDEEMEEAEEPEETAAADRALRLEVVNLTDRDAASQRVAAELVARGYEVVSTRDEPWEDPPETTRIYYREGVAERAVRIGQGMRGIQEVYQSGDLEEGIDIQVRVGLDQFPSD